jgi:hypothetical protein
MIRKAMMAVVASMMLVGGVHSALALTWVDEDNGDPLKFLRPTSPSYSSTFNILLDGFNPATMQVTSAVASFAFADDGDSQLEYVNIYLDSTLFLGGIEVDGTHANIPTSYDWRSGALNGTLIGSLNADGILNYTVTVTSGDTYLKRAKLVAQGGYKVPDGGLTVLLLGASLSGLAVLSRQFGRKN